MPHPALLAATLLLGLLAADPGFAQTTTRPTTGDRLACAPPLGPKATHAEVVAAFGKDNVTFERIYAAEGEKIGATVIHPKDPARRLELIWMDQKKRSGLANVRFSDETTWIAPNGVKRGMSIAEVEKLNGRPFTLSGFFWDYGGYVSDWKGGTLDAAIPGGCVVQVRFAVPDDAPEAATSKVSGDSDFSSADKNMRAAKPAVSALGFGYPEP
mgnify:CR=1 FL=1